MIYSCQWLICSNITFPHKLFRKGRFSIPPIPEADIAGLNSLELRIYQYALEALREEYISPDVTDAAGITAIITDKGVIEKPCTENIAEHLED